jgi:hypothetical protein
MIGHREWRDDHAGRARRWLALLVLAGAVGAPAAMTEFPHLFARAAFGLTGVGR